MERKMGLSLTERKGTRRSIEEYDCQYEILDVFFCLSHFCSCLHWSSSLSVIVVVTIQQYSYQKELASPTFCSYEKDNRSART